MQDQLSAGATIVLVICTSDKTYLTNSLGDQHVWPLYLTIGNSLKDICWTPTQGAWILIAPIPCYPKDAKNTDKAWHSAIETLLSHSGILTLLVPAWSGIVLMDSKDNVILFWQPGSGIIQNKSWLPKSHMVHAQCVKCLMVHWWGIPLFDHSISQEISMFIRSFWMNQLLMLGIILVFIQLETTSGNTLSAMSHDFRSLINCISCSWVQLKSYCTGCSNTWKLEIWRINLTIDSHRYHDSQVSSASLNHLISWNAGPGREKRSVAWSEHWQWIALWFFTALRIMRKLRQKHSLMKWTWEQCGHYVYSL